MKFEKLACLGLVMDGNRRWARERALPVYEGHAEGYKKLREVLGWARKAGVPHVVAYAFSTENWNRAEEEVGYLLDLFRSVLKNETQKLSEEDVRIRFVGDTSRFPEDLRTLIQEVEAATRDHAGLTLHLLVSYGGREEIVAAANRLLAEGVSFVTKDTFAAHLWSHPMLDPDLIIRTGGEKRLSNFLPWQSTYSELFFLDTLWPDFSEEEFNTVLAEFAARERRHGK